ncbi:MAG: hypothetical protein EBV86_15090 [Marivivens sp.]|nr:hypothetical protein [Marivivens sp.]NCW69854.1 hypothetical protein [Marivivens sp.]
MTDGPYVYHVYAMKGVTLAPSEAEADYWDINVFEAPDYGSDPVYEFENLTEETRDWLIANVVSQFACEGEWVYG